MPLLFGSGFGLGLAAFVAEPPAPFRGAAFVGDLCTKEVCGNFRHGDQHLHWVCKSTWSS